jgi:AraC-like DNA-binding protein
MLLKDFLPSPALADFVRFIGIVHFVFSKDQKIPPKAFSPRPGESLYFFPKDPEYVTYPGEIEKAKRPPAFIMGQHTLLTQRYVGHEFMAVVVQFQPGALYHLTAIPTYEFANTYLDAETVFPKDIRFVNEQLNNANCYEELLAIVESYLLKLISQSKKKMHGIEMAAKILLNKEEQYSISRLAKETCFCLKQFERKFEERMGVSPSLFSRISRFDRTFKMKNAHPEKDWLSIAVHCGYHDYQHLARDYKAFTGYTPASFFTREEQAPERILHLHE